jgi:ectoine hydroxylase-related dioxygenase (phytanoyl-CoA dioxygenase family)
MTDHAGFDVEGHVGRLVRDGFTLIEDFLSPDDLAEARTRIDSLSDQHRGRNAFEGYATERIYTLVARGPVFERMTEDARLLALLDRFLLPDYLLTASQSICIHPGEAAQALHIDDSFYRLPRPRPAVSLTLIAAIDAFTAENGATDILPGSHLWDEVQAAAAIASGGGPHLKPAVMPAGAAIILQGNLIHRGGANRSAAPRLAVTNQYCQPWARPQENFFLGVPPGRAAALSPRLQGLLGYGIWPPFMGHVTGSHPLKALEPGWSSPVERQEPPAQG